MKTQELIKLLKENKCIFFEMEAGMTYGIVELHKNNSLFQDTKLKFQ